jgi:AraC-like DNA-binding protein
MRINLCDIDGNKKPLALAMAIKHRYKSSVIKDFSYIKVAKEFGLDRRTVKRYFDKLKKLDLIEFLGRDVLIKKMWSEDKFYRSAKASCDLKKNEVSLNFLLMKHEMSQQEYMINSKKSLKKCKAVKSYGVLDEEIKLSMKTISKLFGCSTNKATRMLKEMPLEVKRNVQFVGKYGKMGKYLPNSFVSNGNVYLVGCNSYTCI